MSSGVAMDQPRTWRNDPALAGRFHPEAPDDCQVVVHAGGPRLTATAPELVWASIVAKQGGAYRARLLNQPSQIPGLSAGDEIFVLASPGSPYPVMATEAYLAERGKWVIHPCDKCGLAELFDTPSDLIRARFPDIPADAELEMFTAFCPLCGGVQGVEIVGRDMDDDADDGEPGTTAAVARGSSAPEIGRAPWWQFWKR
ncbi:MAG: hypothetical protein ACOY82_08050 [Pseudomonadota bacterium]